MVDSSISRMSATFCLWVGLVKSCPPRRPVVLLKRREPMALHCPVMELAPVPGLPMLPVMRERLMMAWAVRVASCPWLMPMVHQKDTFFPWWMVVASFSNISGVIPDCWWTSSGVNFSTWLAKSWYWVVWEVMKFWSIQPFLMRMWAMP